MRRLLIGTIAGIIIILGLWRIAVPDSLITGLIKHALDEKGLQADVEELRKGFFFNFDVKRITITKSGKQILSAENTKGRLDLLSLVFLKLPFFFCGNIGSGSLDGKIDLLKKTNPLDIAIDRAEIEDIPFLSAVGLAGQGTLSGKLTMENNTGEVRFHLADINLKPVAFNGIKIPLDLFYEGRGAMTISGEDIIVKSFALDGNGIYARIKGHITAGRSSLVLELMPDRSFKETYPLLSLLEQYKVSPGYYSIPITGNLSLTRNN